MQNLTARYNYIYNANVILNTHQQEFAETYAENYDQVLRVYLGPEIDSNFIPAAGSGGKSMDEIIKKAQIIILEKGYSNYLDDAYILLGKAHFFKGNYFNAAEYFDYVTKNYKNNTKSYVDALNWKARSLMQVKRLSEARLTLDTLAYVIADLKKDKAEPLATLAQMCIYNQKNEAAIAYLKDAIEASHNSQHKIRWTYILAQLAEQQKDYAAALIHYRKVQKSNAPFEMYFNANLNRIKINALLSGKKINKQDELMSLLKDDKNTDYTDQIYYQIAESFAADEAYEEAKRYYLLSIQKSTKNQYQKGLSYLKTADLNFKQFRDYLNAKLYYDSAVNTLPKSYPGYNIILKKNQNLEYLTKRYEIIAKEDTLQAIAKLPEQARLEKIQAIFNPADKSGSSGTNTSLPAFNESGSSRPQATGTFYFSNAAAISKGFSDFKKKWGNRKLENNWRQSIRSSAQATNQDITNNMATASASTAGTNNPIPADQAAEIKAYKEALPLSPEQFTQSNQKIIDAYYDIAGFYLQELNDPEEAEEVYQVLLARFPNNHHLAAVYYGLFLIYKNKDQAGANNYKNKVLKEFPGSIYAKTILDPSFSLKQTELETAINKDYNAIFEQYQKKDFEGLMQRVEETLKSNRENYLSPQYAYLKAIAIGRTNHVDSLLNAFNAITTAFPDDKLISPLVKDHIAYINLHLAHFQKRKIALTDFDPNEPPFGLHQQPVAALTPQTPAITQAAVQQNNKPEVPATANPVKTEKPIAPPTPAKAEGMFSTAASVTYYYVIDVADASLTLSSSRFGIGQFNRGNYSGQNLRHQLKEFDNDQLIYIGNFSNFDDAKRYANGIGPQLKQIMKVPASIYTGFVISKENFDKLTSKDILNKYLEFYKNNY
ncbi:tetratricopeptide repeat protein [Pedobacter heparinus]|uniref:type IX secretion system periplasmic lipoprotein PorW/SprE n=1 Tax=Pedobacter heparinus TaxID=984 RepID=UPI00292EAEE5|nr:tetratricopeptide repeat protein [Pedobacter heparinus]